MDLPFPPHSAGGRDLSYPELLVLLRSKLTDVVAHVLHLLLLQVDAFKCGRIASIVGQETFCQCVANILDQTNLEKPVSKIQQAL